MTILTKIDSLFQKRKFVFLLFFFLILFQLVYSFIYPSADVSCDYWKNIKEMSFYEGYSESYSYDSFDNSIMKKVYPFLSNYYINGDAGAHIILAHDFPQHYFRGHLAYLDRPLYSFLVYLISRPLHLISDSYSLTFAAGIFLNFILFFFTVIFFYLLVKKIISSRVALLSSFLLIFSSFTHVWLNQPDTNIFGAFFVILSLYLLYNYINRPSLKKLIAFSLIIGILMLGKMILAISLFILILAFFFKRYKEGILFLTIHLIPLAGWYLLVTKIFHFSFYTNRDIAVFKITLIEGWIFKIFQVPWQETFRVLLYGLPLFFTAVIFGFLSIPVILALIGFKKLPLKGKNIFCLSFVFSFFALFLSMDYYTPRHAFLIFPVIYPLAILGMDMIAGFLKKYGNWCSLVFYFATFIFLIIISSVDIFKIFPYGIGLISSNLW